MLVAVSVLALLYLAGLGLLAGQLLPEVMSTRHQTGARAARLMAYIMMLGLLVNYVIVLLLGGLAVSVLAGAGLAVTGWVLNHARRRERALRAWRVGWWRTIGVLGVLVPFGLLILSLPLSACDARSIWYFFAKMIYYTGVHGKGTGWTDPVTWGTHPGYPKLISILAAQVAFVAGFWNEYLPKLNLLVLLIPAVLALASLWSARRISPILFCFAVLTLPGDLLWNGYADAYYGLYMSLSLVFLTQWLAGGELLDLLMAATCCGMTLSLKSEGALFMVAILVGYGVAFVGLKVRPVVPPPGTLRAWLLMTLPFWGFVIWSIQKRLWGLTYDVPSDFRNLPLIRERILGGAIQLVSTWLWDGANIKKSVLLLGAGGFGALLGGAKLPRLILAPVVTLVAYVVGMMLVYLATVNDLAWHLGTSASRTMLPVTLGAVAVVFLMLREVERVGDRMWSEGLRKVNFPTAEGGDPDRSPVPPP